MDSILSTDYYHIFRLLNFLLVFLGWVGVVCIGEVDNITAKIMSVR